MAELMASLYSHILRFFTRAIDWYGQGKLKHALSALRSSFQLKFRDIVEDINETSRAIDRLALIMNQAEVRQTRLQVFELTTANEKLQKTLEENHVHLVEANNLMMAQMKNALAGACLFDEG
jgi:hypothetical protein